MLRARCKRSDREVFALDKCDAPVEGEERRQRES
jgi:hypothetical protein